VRVWWGSEFSAVQFVPPLPEEKRRSIERLGCGTFNVVVLFFSTIFWDKQVRKRTGKRGNGVN